MLEAWRATGPAGFTDQLPRVSLLLATGQLAQVLESAQYLRDVAQAQGLDAAGSVLRPSGFVGRTAAGVPLHEVLALPTVRVSALMESGVDAGTAAQSGAAMLTRLVSNEITQTGTNATQIGMAGNPEFQGYIRMMKPPSCSRCAVMAGSWWKWNDGFPRHPGCDCIHVPAGDVNAGDSLKVNAREYFDSLSEADQDKYFGKTQADAIRGGANLGRTVNAHTRAAGLRKFDSGGTRAGPQMTPKQVFQTAGGDRDQAVRLLHDNGYLEPVKKPDAGWVEPTVDPKWDGMEWDGRQELPWGYRLQFGPPRDPVYYRPWNARQRADKIAEAKRQHKLLQAITPGDPTRPKPWRNPVDPKAGRPPVAASSIRRRKNKPESPEEILDAIRVYTENGAREANAWLRTGEYLDDPETARAVLRGLERLFNEYPDLTTSRGDLVLYRGVTGRRLVDRLEPGATIHDAGYTSTATTQSLARGFGGGDGAILVIRAPAGTRMLNAGSVEAGQFAPGSAEMVLQKGTTLRVISKRVDTSGKFGAPGVETTVIECEIA